MTRRDRAIKRFDRSRIVQGCGLIPLAGAVLVVLAPAAPIAFTGWTVIGAGLALLAPTVLGATSLAVPSSSPGTAIAAVTTLGYLGSFSGPPLIGALAGLLTLSAAIGLLAVAAATAAVLAPVALPRT